MKGCRYEDCKVSSGIHGGPTFKLALAKEFRYEFLLELELKLD